MLSQRTPASVTALNTREMRCARPDASNSAKPAPESQLAAVPGSQTRSRLRDEPKSHVRASLFDAKKALRHRCAYAHARTLVPRPAHSLGKPVVKLHSGQRHSTPSPSSLTRPCSERHTHAAKDIGQRLSNTCSHKVPLRAACASPSDRHLGRRRKLCPPAWTATAEPAARERKDPSRAMLTSYKPRVTRQRDAASCRQSRSQEPGRGVQ